MFEHVTWPFAIIEGGNYLIVLFCLIYTWKKARHLTVLIIAACPLATILLAGAWLVYTQTHRRAGKR